jgi:hypothetical protein
MSRLKLNYKILNSYCIFLLITVFTILVNAIAFGQSYQVTCNTINTDGSIVIEIWNTKSGNFWSPHAKLNQGTPAGVWISKVKRANLSKHSHIS